MGKMVKLLAATCLAALCIALAACGNSNSPAGTWDYDAETLAAYVGDDLSDEQKAAAQKIMFLNLNDDGTLDFVMYGDDMTGTWKQNDKGLTLVIEDEEVAATLADGKLTFDDEEGGMGFVKASSKRTLPTEDEANDALATMLGFDLGEIEFEDTSGDLEATFDEADYEPKELNELEQPVTIADDDTCTIIVTATGVNGFGDPGYNLKVTNKLDKAIYVTEQEFTIGGKEVAAYSDETVEAGETAEVFLAFDAADLGENASVATLVDVKGILEIDDDETVDELTTYPFNM